MTISKGDKVSWNTLPGDDARHGDREAGEGVHLRGSDVQGFRATSRTGSSSPAKTGAKAAHKESSLDPA